MRRYKKATPDKLLCRDRHRVESMLVGLHNLLEDVLSRVHVLHFPGHREYRVFGTERRLGHHDLRVGVVGDLLDHLSGHSDRPLEHLARNLELGRLDSGPASDEHLVVVDRLAPGAVVGDGVLKFALNLFQPSLACLSK